jgi:hypothetical protein
MNDDELIASSFKTIAEYMYATSLADEKELLIAEIETCRNLSM